MFYSQQRRNKAVTAGLIQHAFTRIDQQDRQIAGRRAGCHIAGVLLMTGSIRDDKFAFFGGKITVGHVNSDALFALGLQTVNQQRQIELLALRAMTFTIVVQR